MFIFANNVTTRNAKVDRIFKQAKETNWSLDYLPARSLEELVRQCSLANPDAIEINIQQKSYPPQAMEFAVKIAQRAANCQLVLSSNNDEALEAGLRACKKPPIVNYIAIDEARLSKMLPLVAEHGAEVILLVSTPVPTDAQDMLRTAAVLVGAANESGIANNRIIIDPGILHVTTPMGQQHLKDIIEFIQAMPDTFEPAVRTTCWLRNISAGAEERLRNFIELGLISLLGGVGLSSVFLDIFNSEHLRMAKLVKVFRNELIYADGELKG